MIIIGLLLLIVAAIVGLDIGWKNIFQVPDVVLFGPTLGMHSARVFFLAEIIVGAVLMLGIALILGGIRRIGSQALQRRRDRTQDPSTGRGRPVTGRSTVTGSSATACSTGAPGIAAQHSHPIASV